jgi:hypothetical protein
LTPLLDNFRNYFSQITNLFVNHPFGNNLCFNSSNGWRGLILEIFFSSPFQRSKEGSTWTRFDPNKLCFKNSKHYKISIPKWESTLKFWDFLSRIIPHLYNYVFKSQYIFPTHSFLSRLSLSCTLITNLRLKLCSWLQHRLQVTNAKCKKLESLDSK